MKIKKTFEYIILFLVISFSGFAAKASGGMGDLYITINLNPVGTTKVYNIGQKTVLDTGIYNSKDPTIKNQMIATVDVIMEARKGANDTGVDYCTIDGDFNGILKYKELKNAVETTSIPLKLTKYNGASNVKMTLKSLNYRDKGTIIQKESTDSDYAFTAYPKECNYYNMITKLAYSFDLVLDITDIKNGDIIGGAVEIQASAGKGAVKDLVIAQMSKIMTNN